MKKAFEITVITNGKKIKGPLFETEKMANIFIKEMTDYSENVMKLIGLEPLEFEQPACIEVEESEISLPDLPQEILRDIIPRIAERAFLSTITRKIIENLN